MKEAVKRTPSQLKHISRGDVVIQRAASKQGTEAGPTLMETELEQLNNKMKQLEDALDKEREENRNLQNRCVNAMPVDVIITTVERAALLYF